MLSAADLGQPMYQISQSKEGIKRGRVRPTELNTENLGDPFGERGKGTSGHLVTTDAFKISQNPG